MYGGHESKRQQEQSKKISDAAPAGTYVTKSLYGGATLRENGSGREISSNDPRAKQWSNNIKD